MEKSKDNYRIFTTKIITITISYKQRSQGNTIGKHGETYINLDRITTQTKGFAR